MISFGPFSSWVCRFFARSACSTIHWSALPLERLIYDQTRGKHIVRIDTFDYMYREFTKKIRQKQGSNFHKTVIYKSLGPPDPIHPHLGQLSQIVPFHQTNALWGLRDADRMGVRKCDGRTGLGARFSFFKCFCDMSRQTTNDMSWQTVHSLQSQMISPHLEWWFKSQKSQFPK